MCINEELPKQEVFHDRSHTEFILIILHLYIFHIFISL